MTQTPGTGLRTAARLPLLLSAVLVLLTAMWAGLVRVGWVWPVPSDDLPGMHGALMVCGFLGAVISLERAVALGKWWGWLAPVLAVAGAVALLVTLSEKAALDPRIPRALFTAAAAVLFTATLVIARRQPALFTAALAAGVACWLTGCALWLGPRPLFQAVPWWIGFLVMTIASERLELSRVMKLPKVAVATFVGASAALLAALVVQTFAYKPGMYALGVGLALLAAWLLRYDVARRTIRVPGLTRFIATGLLSGYFWLLVAGLFLMHRGKDMVSDSMRRDFTYHCVFLGFVVSMIFAHAPIIVPAVTGAAVKWSRAFYAPLALLHASLTFRAVNDFTRWPPGREWGALLNVTAILLFIAVLLGSVAAARVTSSAPGAPLRRP